MLIDARKPSNIHKGMVCRKVCTLALLCVVVVSLAGCSDSSGTDFDPMRDARFSWWDTLTYYYYAIRNRYSDYALVVQISYIMTVLSALSIAGVLVSLLFIYGKRRRHERYRRKVLKQYGEAVRQVLADTVELSQEEVRRRLQVYGNPHYKTWEYQAWIHVLLELFSEARSHIETSFSAEAEAEEAVAAAEHTSQEVHKPYAGQRLANSDADHLAATQQHPSGMSQADSMFAQADDSSVAFPDAGAVTHTSGADALDIVVPSLSWENPEVRHTIKQADFARLHILFHNARSIMVATGLQSHMDTAFREGLRADRLFLLHVASQFHLPVPGSSLMRLYNSRNPRTRAAARYYHIFVSPSDPYFFLKEADPGTVYPLGDWLWVHHVLSLRRAAGRDVPSLVPMLGKMDSNGFRSFLILETGFWGSEDDMENITQFFTHHSERCRKAAFVAMAQWGYAKAEPKMMKMAPLQTEGLQRVILVALLTINSGNATDFLEHSFVVGGSMPTKRMALRCLYHYGDQGRQRFEALRQQAPPEQREMFRQIALANRPPRLLADGNIQ